MPQRSEGREDAYREQTLRRLQATAVEMGVTAVLGSAVMLLARLLIPMPEHLWLRVLLLPQTALFAYLIVRAPSVRTYGAVCMATIATVSLNSDLGALGTDQPLIYFLPAAAIVMLATGSMRCGRRTKTDGRGPFRAAEPPATGQVLPRWVFKHDVGGAARRPARRGATRTRAGIAGIVDGSWRTRAQRVQ